MPISGPSNPFGHPDPMVDQMIGTAYDKVKLVAENLRLISMVADALSGVVGTDPMITTRTFKGTGQLSTIGSENRFPLPQYVDPEEILSISVRVMIGEGAYCFNDDRFFYTSIEDGQLVVILRNDAPAEFVNARILWFGICSSS